MRRRLDKGEEGVTPGVKAAASPTSPDQEQPADGNGWEEKAAVRELEEKHFTILYGDTGHTYDSIIGAYLEGAKSATIEDPYIRAPHQVGNFVRFCETLIKEPTIRRIDLVTGYDEKTDLTDLNDKFDALKQSLLELDVVLDVRLNKNLHDREIRLDNGWTVKIGRGLDFYQKPDSWSSIGANDYSLRKCLETKVDIFRE